MRSLTKEYYIMENVRITIHVSIIIFFSQYNLKVNKIVKE
jgi:hypothetical protein